MTNPKVTIGMAVYNGADFIEHALGAVLQQTYPDFTVIVSDNASTDNTWEILQTLAATDSRVVLHRQKSNVGLTRNFRFVLDQADTEFFMWHADDDWLAPNYLEELTSVFADQSDCSLACPFGVRVDQDGNELHREAFPPLESASRFGRVKKLLSHPEGMWIYGLFRTEALREAWGIAEEFKYVWASDAIALMHLILNDKIRGTDKTTFYYRINYPSLYSLRPDTPLKMTRYMAHYLRFHFRLWRQSRLPVFEKLMILPWLINHSVVSLFEHPYKRFIKHPVKRLLKALHLWPQRVRVSQW